MFTNRFTTIAGIMMAMGGLPVMVTASHVAFPLWWNYCQFPLVLCGLVGGILLGVGAKGADVHSTQTEVNKSTKEPKEKQ